VTTPRLTVIVSAAVVFLVGCAGTEQDRLQAEIDALRPDGATKHGECNLTSGFVENAPASLACRYLVDGRLEPVALPARVPSSCHPPCRVASCHPDALTLSNARRHVNQHAGKMWGSYGPPNSRAAHSGQ
jgi:hypothetical protein